MDMIGHAVPKTEPEKSFQVDPPRENARRGTEDPSRGTEEGGFNDHDAGDLAARHADGAEDADLARSFEHAPEESHDDAESGDEQGEHVRSVAHHEGTVEYPSDLLPELQRG